MLLLIAKKESSNIPINSMGCGIFLLLTIFPHVVVNLAADTESTISLFPSFHFFIMWQLSLYL